MNKKQIRPFGVKDEIGYVFGDMAGSFVNLFVDAYFLIFCTNVLGISAGWMGTLFLVARLWGVSFSHLALPAEGRGEVWGGGGGC